MSSMTNMLPASPKELASQMSVAVQKALADKHRKLEVKLPSGLCFGLFGQLPGEQAIEYFVSPLLRAGPLAFKTRGMCAT